MKRLALIAAGAGLVLGLLVLGIGWSLWTGASAPAAGEAPVLLRIPTGMTLTAAADMLVARELLEHRTVFLIGARLTGRERGLRAGLYELDRGISPRDLLLDLTEGRSVQIRVTIPEGLTAPETAAILAEALGFDTDAFLAVADSLVRAEIAARGLLGPAAAEGGAIPARLDSLWSGRSPEGTRALHWCEGYLAPDTYRFAEGTRPRTAARHLVAVQLQRLQEAIATATGEVPLDPHRLLTLASLVETEARLPQEQPLVAAVYSNRIAQGWRLEADPTVAFILGKKGRRLYFKDLKVDSPYNTYQVRGLPPGPIASPGAGALFAAARPDPDCDAMYFVSDGAGGHVFSRTIQEHEEAVRRFRRIRAESSRR